jgi:hypothetical protein
MVEARRSPALPDRVRRRELPPGLERYLGRGARTLLEKKSVLATIR